MSQESELTLAELEERRAELDKQIKERKELERKAALEEISAIAARYDISLQDLVKHLKAFHAAQRKRSVPPKYRDPTTGNTWTGRGRRPHWLKGKDPEDFRMASGIDVTDQ